MSLATNPLVSFKHPSTLADPRLNPSAVWPSPSGSAQREAERAYRERAELPPMPENEMGAVNAEPDFDTDEAPLLTTPISPEAGPEVPAAADATPLPLATAAPELTEDERAEVFALVVEEGLTEEAARAHVLSARAPQATPDPLPAQTAASARPRRIWTRPTVEKLLSDFTAPARLEALGEAGAQMLRERCRTLSGFRAAVFEYVAVTALSQPSKAHEYRFPAIRSIERAHAAWLRDNPAI